MKINITTNGYEVIDHGSVMLFDEKSDITFHIDSQNGFSFSVKFLFTEDQSNEEQRILRNLEENRVTMTCVNFADSGTGTNVPIQLANVGGRDILIHFWAYKNGDSPGKDKVRMVDFTLLRGGVNE